jgi:GDP-L-fucose synthase
MADIMGQVVEFKGEIIFDTTKQDGAPRKLIDISRLKNMGWNYVVNFTEGLNKTYVWYKNDK